MKSAGWLRRSWKQIGLFFVSLWSIIAPRNYQRCLRRVSNAIDRPRFGDMLIDRCIRRDKLSTRFNAEMIHHRCKSNGSVFSSSADDKCHWTKFQRELFSLEARSFDWFSHSKEKRNTSGTFRFDCPHKLRKREMFFFVSRDETIGFSRFFARNRWRRFFSSVVFSSLSTFEIDS